jgi:ADP-ribose pyrophosphatase YjhB (NUDIX family)
MGARFVVTRGAELLKGMTCGRVQLPKGETPIDSVVRRIRRETGLRLVNVKQDAANEGAAVSHYEILLGRGRAKAVAGAIRVTITL